MARPKFPKPKPPKPPSKSPIYKPPDYLSGGQRIGEKYKAWSTFGSKKPDFGKGAGPGIPYHVVNKTVAKPVKPGNTKPLQTDPRSEAIKRRLGSVI